MTEEQKMFSISHVKMFWFTPAFQKDSFRQYNDGAHLISWGANALLL